MALAALACLYNAVYAPSKHKGAVAAGWVVIAATAALLATFLRRKEGGR